MREIVLIIVAVACLAFAVYLWFSVIFPKNHGTHEVHRHGGRPISHKNHS